MARRRRTARQKTRIIRMGAPRAAAPIIKVSAPRAVPARRRRRGGHRRRRSGGGSIGGGLISNDAVQMAIGGALYGFAVKSGWIGKLPAIPVVGRTGTAALLLGYWAKHGGGEHVRNASRAAAAIAGYQLGSTGAIQGDAGTPVMGDFAMGEMEGDDGYAD
jgi:hypothetical protein